MATIYDPITGRYVEIPDVAAFTPAPNAPGGGQFTPGPMAPPDMAAQPPQAPQQGFSGKYPRLSGVLKNLGTGLGNLELEQPQVTPYPVSPLVGALQGVSSGARAYNRAYEGGRAQAIRRSPGVQRATQKVLSGDFQNLSAGDIYMAQLGGLQPPPTYLSGAEQRDVALRQGGARLTEGESEGFKLEREKMAQQSKQFADEMGFNYLKFYSDLGYKEEEILRQGREEQRLQFLSEEQVMDNYVPQGKNSAEQRRVLRKYSAYRSGSSTDRPTADEMAILDTIDNKTKVLAELEGSKIEAREGQFVRFANAAIAARYPDGNIPPEVNDLLLQVTAPGFPQRAAAGEETALEVIAELNKLFPGLPKEEWLGTKFMNWIGASFKDMTRTPRRPAPTETGTGAHFMGVGPEAKKREVSRSRFKEQTGKDLTDADIAEYKKQYPNLVVVD